MGDRVDTAFMGLNCDLGFGMCFLTGSSRMKCNTIQYHWLQRAEELVGPSVERENNSNGCGQCAAEMCVISSDGRRKMKSPCGRNQ
jgi:hypothetical protein